MGFSYNGRCYQDGPTVLDAFNIQFPIVDGTSVVDLVSSSITTAEPPVLTYEVLSRQWSTDTLTSRTGSITLESCTVTGLDQYHVQSIIFPVVMVFAFLMGWNKSAVI